MKNVEYKKVRRHRLPTGALGVAPHADGERAYVACFDGVYALPLEQDGDQAKLLYSHGSYVSNVVLLNAAEQLVSSGYDGVLRWYDLSSRQIVRTAQAHQFWSWDLALSGDQRILASSTGQYLAGDYEYHPKASDEPCVRVFDAVTGQLLSSMEFIPPTQAVAVSDDGQHVAAANLMGDVGVWTTEGEPIAAWNTPDFTAFGIIKSHCQIGGIFATAFVPGTTELLVAGMGPMRDPMAGNGKQRWQRFDWGAQVPTKLAQSKDDQVGEGLMETLAMHPQEKLFVMGGRLRGGSWSTAIFDLETGDLVTSLKTDSRVTQAVFSADGKQLLLAGATKQKKDAEHAFGVVDVYEAQSVPEQE